MQAKLQGIQVFGVSHFAGEDLLKVREVLPRSRSVIFPRPLPFKIIMHKNTQLINNGVGRIFYTISISSTNSASSNFLILIALIIQKKAPCKNRRRIINIKRIAYYQLTKESHCYTTIDIEDISCGFVQQAAHKCKTYIGDVIRKYNFI